MAILEERVHSFVKKSSSVEHGGKSSLQKLHAVMLQH